MVEKLSTQNLHYQNRFFSCGYISVCGCIMFLSGGREREEKKKGEEQRRGEFREHIKRGG